MLRPKLRKDQRVVATPLYVNELGDVRGRSMHDIDNVATEVFGVMMENGREMVCLYPPKEFEGECEGVDLFPSRVYKLRDDIESVASELGVVLNEMVQLHEHPDRFGGPAFSGGTMAEAIVKNAKRMVEKIDAEGYRVELPQDDKPQIMKGTM